MTTPSSRVPYRTGTPRFLEWDGLWKCDPSDTAVTKEEYEQVSCEFDNYCRKTYRHSPEFPKDFYIRGDYTGDRTQILEIRNPSILTRKLLHEIQQWLSAFDHLNWRVLIPTYLAKPETIIVYPSIIRISPPFEQPLEKGLEMISSRMRRS